MQQSEHAEHKWLLFENGSLVSIQGNREIDF